MDLHDFIERRPPRIATRIGNYTRAVSRWIAAGRPVRSDEQVRYIYETYCKPCEHFDERRNACLLCGCYLSPNGAALQNKLRMATEHCPLQPAKW